MAMRLDPRTLAELEAIKREVSLEGARARKVMDAGGSVAWYCLPGTKSVIPARTAEIAAGLKARYAAAVSSGLKVGDGGA